jgi:hypothetical protein
MSDRTVERSMGGAVTSSLSLDGVFVHPKGLCESNNVGRGTRVWAFAHVLADARIGRDRNICDGKFVENGASAGDRVTIKNQVMIFEGVHVADEVFGAPPEITLNLPSAKTRGDDVPPKGPGASRIIIESQVLC